MEVATIRGFTHNPGAPRGWTIENGACGTGTIPIIYRKDEFGNDESVSAWKPTPDELKTLNEGGFVMLSVLGWQVPVCLYVDNETAASEGR